MTEQEWLECGDPDAMLDFLMDRGTTDRTFRHFACACVRRQIDLLADQPWAGAALAAAEQFADGAISQAEMDDAADEFDAADEAEDLDDPADTASTAVWHLMGACKAVEGSAWHKGKAAARQAADAAGQRGDEAEWARRHGAEVAVQVGLLRCVANPFRSPNFDPAWRTPTAVGIAQRMYDAREFSAMPILADALQDAGCEDETILSHCRAAGQVHVRGCWVCDLVLQKA